MTEDSWDDLVPEIIEVDDETWDWLRDRLAQPAKRLPALQNLMERFLWTS